MEIILIRHGKPKVELSGKVSSREISSIIKRYNESGVSDNPPDNTIQAIKNCSMVICSDFPRSLQSAEALGFTHVQVTDSLFREVAIPHFKRGSIILPVSVWSVILRSLSVFGFSRNGESLQMAKNRAKLAASFLIKLARKNERILLVGHGFINHFIAKELLSQNWTGPKKPESSYWGYNVYLCNTT